MAQSNGKDPITTKLRITGIKEPVVGSKMIETINQ